MPNRYLRESILTSKAVNQLTPEQEVFYRRLMSVVDDYGRFEADPELLKATMYPVGHPLTSADICAQLLADVSSVRTTDGVPLVVVYSNGKRNYLQITNFDQRMRSKSRYPDPDSRTSADICGHPPASAASRETRASNSNSRTRTNSRTSLSPDVRAEELDSTAESEAVGRFVEHVVQFVNGEIPGRPGERWKPETADPETAVTENPDSLPSPAGALPAPVSQSDAGDRPVTPISTDSFSGKSGAVSVSDGESAEIEAAAGRIHARHPGHRRRTFQATARALWDVVSPWADRMATVNQIDERHAAWCASEEWAVRKIVPGLEKWLREGGWQGEPPPAAAAQETEPSGDGAIADYFRKGKARTL